ncbi:MAG: type II secretion system F family protein [Propioniciclava sp.]
MIAVVAAGAAAMAVWLVGRQSPPLERLGSMPEPFPEAGRRHASGWWLLRFASCLLLPGGGWLMRGMAGAVFGLVAVIVLLTVTEVWRRYRVRRERQQRRQDVVQIAEAMSGLLQAGRVPLLALQETAQEAPLLVPVVHDVATGGDVSAALRRAAAQPGGEGLKQLAEAWDVAAATGAPQAKLWDQAAASLAADDEVARLVLSEVAAARAAGRVMAGLPWVGILLGYVMGGDPADFLTATPVGWICLVLATLLASSGLLWIDAIADAGGRPA